MLAGAWQWFKKQTSKELDVDEQEQQVEQHHCAGSMNKQQLSYL